MVRLVRDNASRSILRELGVADVEVAGCPSLFLPENSPGAQGDDVLLSIRHPSRMSVPPALQWRIAEDVRRLIAALSQEFGNVISLVCHDYNDIEFAAAFPGTRALYFDDVERYIATLRRCQLTCHIGCTPSCRALRSGFPQFTCPMTSAGRTWLPRRAWVSGTLTSAPSMMW